MSSVGKVILTVIVIVLVVWGVSALVGGRDNSVQGDTYKIGFILPLTGDAAAYGEPGRNTFALAIEEINAAGGVDGRMLEPVFEDGKCSGKDSASAMQKLVSVDKVEVVIGGFCSGESLAAIPIAEAAKIAMLSPGSSSPDLTGKSPFFFRNYPSDATQGRVLAEISANVKKWKKIAVIQEQSDYALGNYKAFNENFTRLGGTTVKEEFPSNISDFRSSLAKLKSQNPDALLIIPQTPAAGEKILKQLAELNWKPQLLVADAISGDPKIIENNKLALEGALAAEFGTDPSNTKFSQLVANYKNKYGVDLAYQSYMQTLYDAVYMIANAIEDVGYDGEEIAEWSRMVKNWAGASGSISIDTNGDRASGHVPRIIHNGKVENYTQ